MTCEKCGYVPWIYEKRCSHCEWIEDQKWNNAAPARREMETDTVVWPVARGASLYAAVQSSQRERERETPAQKQGRITRMGDTT